MDDDLDIDGIEEDDLIDDHLFDLNGRDLDGTGDRWAYPFSQSVIPHSLTQREVQGTHYSGSESRYSTLLKSVIIVSLYGLGTIRVYMRIGNTYVSLQLLA